MITQRASPTCTVVVMPDFDRGHRQINEPAVVLPFPPSKRAAKVLDTAGKLAKCRTSRHRSHYLEMTRTTLIGVLTRRGVAETAAVREADRFLQAVMAESAKLRIAGGTA